MNVKSKVYVHQLRELNVQNNERNCSAFLDPDLLLLFFSIRKDWKFKIKKKGVKTLARVLFLI